MSYFNKTLILSKDFRKNTQRSNFMKILPVGAELFNTERTERQTDMTNLIVAFRNVANAPRTQSVALEDKLKIKADVGI